MKTRIHLILAAAILSTFNLQLSTACAQGTAFMYQGRLVSGGAPANGSYDLTFTLFSTNASGVPIAGPVTNSAIAVSNGLFTATIDFGGAFTGTNYWLELAVQTNGSDGFSTLSPRQPILPVPYAIYSANAGNATTANVAASATSANSVSAGNIVGTMQLGQLPGTILTNGSSGVTLTGIFSGDGEGLTNLNVSAAQLSGSANGNFIIGGGSTNGFDNTAVGLQALSYNTNGYNTAIGENALQNNLSGQENTAIGDYALYELIGGNNNIAIGFRAGENISINSSSNIDIGNPGGHDENIIRIGSGQAQTYIAGVINGNGAGLTNLNISVTNVSAAQLTGSASESFIIGGGATSAFYNTAIGYEALENTSGGGNTAIGLAALYENTSGGENTAIGLEALYENTIGYNNTAVGSSALQNITSGYDNTAVGVQTLFNTSGNNNIALGYSAGYNLTTGGGNIDIGNQGVPTDTNIIRIGSGQTQTYIAGVITGNGAGLTNLNGVNGAQLPANILTNNESAAVTFNNTLNLAYEATIYAQGSPFLYEAGSGNFGAGLNAGNLTMSGSDNTAIGSLSLFNNTSGSYNTAIGYDALYDNTSGTYNTAAGALAMVFNSTGSNNVANGYGSLNYNTTGYDNTANGYYSLLSNTSGSGNTANGSGALAGNQTGNNNTADGINALAFNTGSANTADGTASLNNCTSGNFNIGIGYFAGVNITTGSSNIDIGNIGVSTDNNLIRIGTTQTATYLVGTVYANAVALTSDRNAKENFTALDGQTVLAKVASLPVTEWNYKTDSKDVQHIGPMAQDFQAAFGLNGKDDKHISVIDEGGVALAAIQGLNQKLEAGSQNSEARIQKLEAENTGLKQQNDSLEKRLNELEAAVKLLANK